MKTLIIYDENGKIVFTSTGQDVKESTFSPMVAELPKDKRLLGVDVETGELILGETPKKETELLNEALSETTLLIAQQQEQIELQNQALMELTMLIAGGNE